MLLTFALLAQATLPADNGEATRLCAAAQLASGAAANSTYEASVLMYFAIRSASENGGTGRVLDRLTGGEMQVISAKMPSVDAPAAVLAACRTRFPLAWAKQTTLPSDPYTRGGICFTVVSFLGGFVGGANRPEEKARFDALGTRFAPLWQDDALRKRGINSVEQAKDEADRLLVLSLQYGNGETVVNACDKAYPR